MKNFHMVLLFAVLATPLFSLSQIYVSPTGSAGNPGTLASPTTLQNAITVVQPGQTIYMRGGTYNYSATILIASTNNGSSGSLKSIVAYNGEVPILDFGAQSLDPSNRGIIVDGDYWYFKGLIIQNAGDNGVLLAGNNNTFENCIFRRNRDSGLQMSRYNTSATSISQWPSNNLVLNCEAFDNKDATSENADGFAAKLTCGNGNIFRGCISHNNADDGWDFYAKTETGPIGPVTLEGCVAYRNGTLTDGTSGSNGDRNGFKLGGSGIAVNHIVRRCIAFSNGHHGFTDNDNPGVIELSNNTSWDNDQSNFNFRVGSKSVHRNNLSFAAGSSDKTEGTDVGNSNVWWKNNVSTNSGSLVVSSADFQSLTFPSNFKNADGSPNLGNFLALASGSDLINAGVTAPGITFSGSAPDIGARESGGTTPPPTTYTLTTTASPTAGGTISRSPNASSYAAGTVVTLTATPASGYQFSNWTGAASGTNPTTTVTVNSNSTATAVFTVVASNMYTLTTAASPAAGGTITRSPNASSYAAGTVVTLTAIPASGYTFSSWSGSASGTNATTTVTVNANSTATANFTVTGGGGTNATIRIEDNATTATGLCSYDGSISSNSGASNGNVINLTNSTGKAINWKVNAGAAGSYTLAWRYTNSSSSNTYTMKLIVNGANVNSAQAFPKTSSSSTFATSTTTVNLVSGGNTIRLETVASSATADIDWMEVTGTSPTAGNCGSSARESSGEAITSASAITLEKRSNPEKLNVAVYPNPVISTINLQIAAPKAGQASIAVFDQNNRCLTNVNRAVSAGVNNVTAGDRKLDTGIYIVKVLVNGEQKTMKVMVQ